MFDRYNTVVEEDTRKAVDQLQAYLASVDQTVYQEASEKKKELAENGLTPCISYGAEGGTRTRTGIHPLDPEPSASTNSATSAFMGLIS